MYDLVKIKKAEYKEENDFFLHNYKVPDVRSVSFEKKNNLIIILLESFEKDLKSDDGSISYIPRLKNLYSKYPHSENLINCHGTTWTIAALTSWFFGVPLKLPFGVDGNKYLTGSFLPHAVSVFDVMKQNGYSCYLYMGSNAKFSGIEFLFKRGDYKIFDVQYYKQHIKMNEQNKNDWGVYDFILYDELYKKYIELRSSDKPFVLFLQTLDTHSPGYCPKDKRKFNDIRDSWVQADILLAEFIVKMEKFLETDNVNILIFGDHSRKYSTKKTVPLFNLFLGKNMPKIPQHKLKELNNPMDIAPTVLQAAGAKWDNDQFGLGISLFSKEKSFSEKNGIDGLNEKILYESKFYDAFF